MVNFINYSAFVIEKSFNSIRTVEYCKVFRIYFNEINILEKKCNYLII